MAPSAMMTTVKALLCSSLLLPSFPGLVNAARQGGTGERQGGHRTASESETEESAEPEWTYRRASNGGEEPYSPSEWDIGYPDCAGDAQSPIDLTATTATFVEATEFNLELFGAECTSDHLSFHASEYEWEVDFTECSDGSLLHFDGGVYSLLQMHIHSPSEHMIGGSLHDAEIHLVHSRDDTDDESSELLVVAILLDTNEHGWSVALEPLWDVLGSGETAADGHLSLNPYDLLPANLQYSHYMGSLTTPPCSEIVRWVVMSTPTVIGKLQLETFRESVATHEESKVDERSNTNRPAQAVNGRTVYIV